MRRSTIQFLLFVSIVISAPAVYGQAEASALREKKRGNG